VCICGVKYGNMQHIDNLSTIKRATWIALCLTIAVAIWFPPTASADIVSGRILGPDEKPIVNGTFTAKDSKGEAIAFKSDKTGNFSVYLDPGKFTVASSTDATLTGVIESFPQPRQQDVRLTKK
jgi:hypothetical protein